MLIFNRSERSKTMKFNKLQQTSKIKQLLAAARFDDAMVELENFARSDSKNSDLRVWQCKLLLEMERFEDAFTLVRNLLMKATSSKQIYVDLFFDVLRSAYEKRKYDFVLSAATWLAEFQDSIAMAWNFRGLAHLARSEFPEALGSLQKAIERDKNNPHILVNLINAFISNGFPDEALPYAEKGLKLAPNMPVMINTVANAYKYAGELNLSIELYQRALTFEPNNAEVLANLGAAYTALDKKQLALDCFSRALQLRPDLTTIKSNIAFILVEDGRLEEALAFCEEDLRLNPHSPHVWFSYGYLLMKANRLNAAIDAFVKAVSVSQHAMSSLLLPGIYSQLLFCMISHPDIPLSEIVTLSKEFNEKFCLSQNSVPTNFPNKRDPNKRIKLGFVGNSFVRHSCSRFVRPLIANLDRSEVEVYIYATQGKEDDYTEWYRSQADHFRNCSGIGDRQMLMKIKEDQIDVLCELDGHCYGNRLMMFSKKPAPVSFHWLDYGTSTGLTAIDYYLSDRFTAPYEIQPVISEKIWHLEGHSTVFEPASEMGELNELPYLTNGYIT
ncbi:MAG: tetratricopeptide repeat protein, partial [Burkholderiaceae bacterium]